MTCNENTGFGLEDTNTVPKCYNLSLTKQLSILYVESLAPRGTAQPQAQHISFSTVSSESFIAQQLQHHYATGFHSG